MSLPPKTTLSAMSIRGQKIHIDLGDEDGDDGTTSQPAAAVMNFIGDVRERQTSQATPPQPPAPRATTDGFPTHRKRLHQSRFKSNRSTSSEPAAAITQTLDVPAPPSTLNDEQRQIDLENQARLASMTNSEIQAEREELLQNINPAIVQALLKRSKLESGDDNADFPGLQSSPAAVPPKPKKPAKTVTFSDPAPPDNFTNVEGKKTVEVPVMVDQDDEVPQSDFNEEVSTGTIHFPRPEQPPELDPNSPSFLEDLHKKYFPSLPADPEKLEWMRPATDASSYSPTQSGLDPKDIRFAFSGALIPPSAAADIPVTAGLHHHGDAPDAAGYTVSELARLARSKVAAQRCIAFQTLGRILYRLGKGEFGNPSEGKSGTVGAEDTLGELARGLWSEVEKEQVINICTSESEGKSMTGQRHVSAQAYATEAVWLWQKGGGRRWRTD